MRTIRRVRAASFLLLGATANVSCIVSPQPIPVVPAELPELEVHDVKVVRTASSTELLGDPGALGAAETGDNTLWAFAIDAPRVSAEMASAAGSSFEVSLASPDTQMIHLELESWSGAVVGPWNFKTESDGTLGRLPSPRCLSNDAAGGILFVYSPVSNAADTFKVKLTETCGEKADIHVALHTGERFRLQAVPTSIGPHETLSLSIVHPKTGTSGEDIDLLVVTDANPDANPGAMVVSLHDGDPS